MKKGALILGLSLIIGSVFSGESSASDVADYRKAVKNATRNKRDFHRFKQNRAYTRILEHVSKEHGQVYYNKIIKDYPHLMGNIKLFKRNDCHGGPLLQHYPKCGLISPTTLRYVYILGDLHKAFGSLEGKKIVEIGGGYGGQCLILSLFDHPDKYDIYDLPIVNLLIRKYLLANKIENFRTNLLGRRPHEHEYDLVISNFAFSECKKAIQDRYLEEVIDRANQGYMILNYLGDPDAYTNEEVVKKLHKFGFKTKLVDNGDGTITSLFYKEGYEIKNSVSPIVHWYL